MQKCCFKIVTDFLSNTQKLMSFSRHGNHISCDSCYSQFKFNPLSFFPFWENFFQLTRLDVLILAYSAAGHFMTSS